jgi:hypothetical protein
MQVFTVNFHGLWLGGFAVVVAENKTEARALFQKQLKEEHPYLLALNKEAGSIEVDNIGSNWPICVIQSNGDY